VRIPKELEMPGDEVLIRREGDRLILEPVGLSMAELLASLRAMGPIDEPWPGVDEGLLPLEPVPDLGEDD
jgi:antitoxin VapB